MYGIYLIVYGLNEVFAKPPSNYIQQEIMTCNYLSMPNIEDRNAK